MMGDKRQHPAQSTADPVEGWPAGVRPISQDGLECLGVGNDGAIYWEGKPIEVRKTLYLGRWQRIGAITLAASAVVAAASAAVSAYCDYQNLI